MNDDEKIYFNYNEETVLINQVDNLISYLNKKIKNTNPNNRFLINEYKEIGYKIRDLKKNNTDKKKYLKNFYYSGVKDKKYINCKLEIFVNALLEIGYININNLNFNVLNKFITQNNFVNGSDNGLGQIGKPFQKSALYRVIKKIKQEHKQENIFLE